MHHIGKIFKQKNRQKSIPAVFGKVGKVVPFGPFLGPKKIWPDFLQVISKIKVQLLGDIKRKIC
jgi:hypothetical protein